MEVNTVFSNTTDVMTESVITDRGGVTIPTTDLGDGRLMPIFPGMMAWEVIAINEKFPSLSFRDDDILLCSFPKTGTNWLYEVISMILNQSAERVTSEKAQLMMEARTHDEMDVLPSPRIMNTHVQHRGGTWNNEPSIPELHTVTYSSDKFKVYDHVVLTTTTTTRTDSIYLPVDTKCKHIKTVLVVRNPKDTTVSFYNHYTGLQSKSYNGKWEDWLPVYMEGGMEYGPYEEYLQGWETAIKTGLGFPLHIVYYEDMKEDGLLEIQRLADFLGVDVDSHLKETILDKCSFKTMAAGKFSAERKKISFKEHFNFFRKGEVGDWKNWFTVAQNEAFDELWTRNMAGYNMFNFRYEL